jgi:hypothetical protein
VDAAGYKFRSLIVEKYSVAESFGVGRVGVIHVQKKKQNSQIKKKQNSQVL